jgi:hypothetical protein
MSGGSVVIRTLTCSKSKMVVECEKPKRKALGERLDSVIVEVGDKILGGRV